MITFFKFRFVLPNTVFTTCPLHMFDSNGGVLTVVVAYVPGRPPVRSQALTPGRLVLRGSLTGSSFCQCFPRSVGSVIGWYLPVFGSTGLLLSANNSGFPDPSLKTCSPTSFVLYQVCPENRIS